MVNCVACGGAAVWFTPRSRYECTGCGLAFDSSASVRGYEDLPDLSEHLVTEPLADSLAAPTWKPSQDVPKQREKLDDEPLVVWNLEFDESEATTDGRIG